MHFMPASFAALTPLAESSMTTQSAAASCNATKNKERLIQEINELMKIFRAILEKVKHTIK